MRTTIILVASLTVLLLASPALPAEPMLQNLPGADFKPEQLRLPLTVTERSGVERKGTVVSSGVPFPPGFLTDVSKLAVLDKDGKPVVSQAIVTVKWHKPVYDDSAQWVLVSFVADVPANGTATYYLTDDGKTQRRLRACRSRRPTRPWKSRPALRDSEFRWTATSCWPTPGSPARLSWARKACGR